jgi:TPP-dependent pyruvate/acetoin dehydrogenase alpha subunit
MIADVNTLSEKVLQSRFAQLIINEGIKVGKFKIPIHLALGHEALSEAVGAAMQIGDKMLCTHRNIHYQFARGAMLVEILDEFELSNRGLGNGKSGSMNLANPRGSIIYTSSILGNNLCVGLGVALSKKINREDGVVILVTGDGAMEEGAFYETIENSRNMDLPIIILVENNNWSLASQIYERRKPINLRQLSTSLGARYTFLEGNDPTRYYNEIVLVRDRVNSDRVLELVEVKITTLGGWTLQTEDFPEGKYVNYHAGKAPKVFLGDGPVLSFDDSDPVFLIAKSLGEVEFERLTELTMRMFSDYIMV